MLEILTMNFQLNTWICIDLLKITDLGGAIIVHTFACIFGLAVARCLFKPTRKNHNLEESNYVSDTFALIGTVFLWCYWPSFNAGPGIGIHGPLGLVQDFPTYIDS